MLRLLAERGLGEYFVPGSGGVDQDSRGHDIALTARNQNKPPAVAAFGPHAAGAGADDGTALRGVDSIEDNEPCVVGAAIGIFEGVVKTDFERQPRLVGDEIELARARQNLAPADPIVKHKPEP